MSIEQYTKEELQEMFLIEVAYEILNGGKTPYSFHEILAEVSRILELSDEEVHAKMAQFYTDINIDGRFLSLGDNRWGLRTWYPVDKSEEDVVTVTKPKKKKSKKAVEDDFDDFDDADEDFEDFEEDLDDEDLLDEDEDLDEEDDLLDDDLAEDEDEEEFEEELDEGFEELAEDEDEEDLDEEDEFSDEDEDK
ncbi:DNA-directed RNA polymerase subunit delta [Bacillus sp. B1-b2]|uniref:DNA-directed RNA polymerase subunit delta n=1 Tax=Bacillus sp. B1-b2 TaxID=2653201 RepID=UPI001261AAAE|nr:DNA-directed RNA polymerase subunit delta [Bacillus sp. B1-b2]KAB7671863.1 DNA-directed RNA polymerase subunit delta [Bacillus sp. B1-b2]